MTTLNNSKRAIMRERNRSRRNAIEAILEQAWKGVELLMLLAGGITTIAVILTLLAYVTGYIY